MYREINEKFYGSAAPQMTAYWQFIDHVWIDTPEYSGCGFAYLRRWTPENLTKARELMNAGLAAAKTEAEEFRVRLADDSLKLFELFMKLRYDQAEGRFANLGSDGEKWHEQIRALQEKYKAQSAFSAKLGGHLLNESYFGSFYEKTYKDASRLAKDFNILTAKPIRQFKYLADPEKKGEAAGYAKADFDDAAWKSTDVAAETWSSLGYHDYFKSLWYRARVPVPTVPAGKKVYLWLASTDGSAKVFVNGQAIPYVGEVKEKDASATTKTGDEAKGYCQPFSFDITSAVKAGAENQISILCTRSGFNELGTGGLLGPVAIYCEK